MLKQHFTATGIVFNQENKILMINHKKLKVWLPPGGHIEENELPDKAVLREIYEETGVKAELLQETNKLDLRDDNRCKQLTTPFLILLEDIGENTNHKHIDLIYLCHTKNDKLELNTKETQGVNWFSLEEIKQLQTYPNVIKTVEKALTKKATYQK